MQRALLAIDVGGSTTRAALVDETGRVLGRGRNLGGNPASNTPDQAATAMIAAVEAAVSDAGGGPFEIIVAQLALAGPEAHVARGRLEAAFRKLGLIGPILIAGDLLAMFASATLASQGYCIVAGTGAGAIRVRDGAIDRVVDLAGWLLGDLGSGYWLGHEAAKAVCAELEGRGEQTALTPALLDALGIAWSDERRLGRPAPLRQLIDAIYALRPIELARFAPLVIDRRTDPVAARLIAQAERYLTADFAMAFEAATAGPVVLGGGVVRHLTGLPAAIAEIVRAAGHRPDIRYAADGSIGAIVLAMRAVGVIVDETTFQTIAESAAGRQTAAPAMPSRGGD
ncbi:MAG TPA: BadF/BadG/BcrA/BcrD ATPase family protein [Devosia sp.]|nr:BadF/BadG/BcrA/BcrD ATPase family protein [Devosia sp.]